MTTYNVLHGLAGLTRLDSYETRLTAGRELHPAPKVFLVSIMTHPIGTRKGKSGLIRAFACTAFLFLLSALIQLLAKPPRPQKKNDAGPAELRSAGPASFFKAAPPAAAQGGKGKTGL